MILPSNQRWQVTRSDYLGGVEETQRLRQRVGPFRPTLTLAEAQIAILQIIPTFVQALQSL